MSSSSQFPSSGVTLTLSLLSSSSMVLMKMKTISEDYLGYEVTSAVIVSLTSLPFRRVERAGTDFSRPSVVSHRFRRFLPVRYVFVLC